MRTIALASSLFCLLLGLRAAACTCTIGDPAAAFDDAKAVFIAEVIQGTEQVSVPGGQGASQRIEAGEVRLAVGEVFKGEVGGATTVVSRSEASCGLLELRRGKQYVFYVKGDDDSRLYTGPCTRTAPSGSDEVRADMQFLLNLPPTGAGGGGTLRGSVRENRRWQGSEPLPGVSVRIQGPESRQFTATTGADGKFQAQGLPPGKYRVEPQYSPTHVGERGFAEVELVERGTADVDFEAFIHGELLLRIVDRQGRPFNNARPQLQEAQLINNDATFPADARPIGAGGEFLARGVPPGEYLLYLIVEDPRERRRQKYFYPGTFNQGEALTFKMGMAEKKRATSEFRLPEGFTVRTVTGRVTFKDGRPAPRTWVSLDCGTASNAPILREQAFGVTVDNKGRFRIDGIVGQKYLLSSFGYDAANEVMQAPRTPIEITPGEGTLERDLVLSQSGYSPGCGALTSPK